MSYKVVQLAEHGGPEKFQDAEWKVPALADKPGYVRVAVKAASVNPVDYKLRKGLFPLQFPAVVGSDFAGIVEEVGPDCVFKVGDEVYGMSLGFGTLSGSYAEKVTISQDMINLKPKNISFEEAGSLGVVGMTAVHAVERARLSEGQTVLINGATGGVGQIILQLAKNAKTKVITLAGSDSSIKLLNETYGVPTDHIINYTGLTANQITEKVKQINGGNGVDAAFDNFGGHVMKQALTESLGFGGQLLTIVEEEKEFNALPLYPSQSPSSLFSNDASLQTIFVGARSFGPASVWRFYRELLGRMTKEIEADRLKPPTITVVGTLSAATVAKAHEMIEQHKTHSKLIIKM